MDVDADAWRCATSEMSREGGLSVQSGAAESKWAGWLVWNYLLGLEGRK